MILLPFKHDWNCLALRLDLYFVAQIIILTINLLFRDYNSQSIMTYSLSSHICDCNTIHIFWTGELSLTFHWISIESVQSIWVVYPEEVMLFKEAIKYQLKRDTRHFATCNQDQGKSLHYAIVRCTSMRNFKSRLHSVLLKYT